jgi:hypothetical protein
MKSSSCLERFVSRLAIANATGPVYAGDEAGIQRIILCDPPIGDVVGKLQATGREVGAFCVSRDGEIRFRFAQDDRWIYVNRGLVEFQAAARIFNAFCWSAYDFDDPECECFDEIAARFSAALEKIEPLGNPDTSLWSATVHDTEGGLWTLY